MLPYLLAHWSNDPTIIHRLEHKSIEALTLAWNRIYTLPQKKRNFNLFTAEPGHGS